jgi:GcrA cell cycle regulator
MPAGNGGSNDRLWKSHDINILIKDWPTKSQSQIGAELHRTRSAVAGKANRLKAAGLLPNGVAKHYADKPHQARPARPAPRLKPVMLKTVQRILMEQGPAPLNGNAKPCTLLELTDSHCHWPIGDPKQPNFYFCGDAKQWDVPYCAHHIRVAYSRP